MLKSETTVEAYIEDYPFLKYIKEDKSRYTHAKDAGFIDPDDDFLIGDSGGFLLNINEGDKFINTELLTEPAIIYNNNKAQYEAAIQAFRNDCLGSIDETSSALFTEIESLKKDNELIMNAIADLATEIG